MTDANTVGIGHNLPPEPLVDLMTALVQSNTDITERRDELLDSFKRMPGEIANDEMRGKFADQVRFAKKCKKVAETRHTEGKAPHLAAGRVVDEFFKRGYIEPLTEAWEKLENIMSVYDRKKLAEERRVREEEARRAKEAADQAAAEAETDEQLEEAIVAEEQAHEASAEANASVADMTRGRGEMGAVSSMSTKWTHRIVDARIIDLEALRPHLSLEVLDKACRAFVKAGGRELKGVDIYEEHKTVVR